MRCGAGRVIVAGAHPRRPARRHRRAIGPGTPAGTGPTASKPASTPSHGTGTAPGLQAQAACTQDAAAGQTNDGSYQNFGLGYIAVDGNEALAGNVGTYCNVNFVPTCATNSDPAAIFSSGQSFATLYNAALAAAANSSPSNNYSLEPCIEIGSAWYLNAPG